MAYEIEWHKRDDIPLIFNTYFLISQSESDLTYTRIEYIKDNFGGWADDVIFWAYSLPKDEQIDQKMREATELFGAVFNTCKLDNQSKCKSHSTDNSWKWSDRDKSKDVSDTKHQTLFYRDSIRRYLSHIENGNFDIPLSYYRRIDHIFECGMRGIPINWNLVKADELWE